MLFCSCHLSSDNNYINQLWQSRFEEIPITAVRMKNAASGTDPVRVVKTRMANRVSPLLQAHLRLLDAVSVFILSPVSGAA
jgi:hypothetical protein